MSQEVLGEVAFLFVEQFDNLYGMLVDRTDVKRIRRAADDGEAALYSVVADVFGDKLDHVMKDAAYGAMDFIAYVDETWKPKDANDKAEMLDMQKPHLDSLAVLLRMASANGCSTEREIREIQAEAERNYRSLMEKPVL